MRLLGNLLGQAPTAEKWVPAARPRDDLAAWIERVEFACQWRGMVRPEAAAWIAPIVRRERDAGTETICVAVRSADGDMPPARKAELGASKRLKLGERFWSALTESGKVDPKLAAEGIVLQSIHAWYRERDELELPRL